MHYVISLISGNVKITKGKSLIAESRVFILEAFRLTFQCQCNIQILYHKSTLQKPYFQSNDLTAAFI